MKAPLTIAAAVLALLAGAPGASALTLQTQSDRTTLDTTLPDDPPPLRQQNLRGEPAETNGLTTHIGGATLHFGMSRGNDPSTGNQWFLESPAARTVPSQAR